MTNEKTAFLFPGQGSQKSGMGKDLYESSDIAKAIFDKADMCLDIDIKGLCFDGSDDELKKTENTQPAIFTVSMALWEMLKTKGAKGMYCAGHSLGEFSAIVSAGYMSFEDAVKTVRKRGLIMAEADKEGKGAMSALLGLAPEKVKEICDSVDGLVVPANYNSLIQVVISGEKDAVAKAGELAKENGAKRVVPLNVSGPFHSPLMEEAAKEFEKVLDSVEIYDTSVKVISNVSAKEHSVDTIKKKLVEQIFSPVQWVESIQYLYSFGINSFVEVGPGQVLSGLMKKIVKDVETHSVSAMKSFDELD